MEIGRTKDVPSAACTILLRPTPTYEVATETGSINEGEESDTNSRTDEIRQLRAQKAAIQRRIEELEGPETDGDSRGRWA